MLFKKHTITGCRKGPRLLVTAGVHGDEPEPVEAVKKLAETITRELLSGQLTLVPTVNEPAFRLNSRVGEDQLDLARVCPGRQDGTITERIAYEVSDLIGAADYYIDLHTGGKQLQVWPLAGYFLHPKVSVLEKQRRMARAFNLPVIWGTSGELQGRTLSVARELNVPAIYVEYLGSVATCEEAVAALHNGCLHVMSELGMWNHPISTCHVRYFAEETASNSGHLQACHPSPDTGVFEPVVSLGMHLCTGDPIGYVFTETDQARVSIFADKDGHVLALAYPGQVQQNQGLAVIVEFEEFPRTRTAR